MNVLNKFIKLFLVLSIIITLFNLSFSFNVCNVEINEPWFNVKNSDGKDILFVDNEGDMYFQGEDHITNNKNTFESLDLGNSFFNNQTSYFGNFFQEVSSLPSTYGLIIRSSSGNDVAKFLRNGDIYTKGKGVFEGSQGGCLPDGWLYCSGDIRQNRDYYCDITGDKTGVCKYITIGTEDCSSKSTYESDGGINKNTKGYVKDYITCNSGSCTFNTYWDTCNGNILKEYYSSGSSYSSTNIDCTVDYWYYCVGSNRYKKYHICNDGDCSDTATTFVETCTAPSTDYGSWSCYNSDTRVRSVTTYSPVCTPSGCSYSSSTYSDFENCGYDQYCSGGSCYDYTYSWVYDHTSSCSASCGGGTKTIYYKCIRDQTGETVSNSYCGGSNPTHTISCNTQPCCSNECSISGSYKCEGLSLLKCGNYDSDPCLEYKTITTCTAPSTNYGSWSCYDFDTRVRSVTTYSPMCTPSGCSYSSSTYHNFQNAPSGYYCNPSTGSWKSTSCTFYSYGKYSTYGGTCTSNDGYCIWPGQSFVRAFCKGGYKYAQCRNVGHIDQNTYKCCLRTPARYLCKNDVIYFG